MHAGRWVRPFRGCFGYGHRSDQTFDFGQRDNAGPQQQRHAGQRQHGGFDTDPRRAAIQNEIGKLAGHVLRRGGRKLGEAVGAGRGDWHLRGADQLESEGVRGHAQPHRGQARGDDVRHHAALGHHQRQRPRPVVARQGFRRFRPIGGQRLRHRNRIHVYDQRARARPPLGGEDALHRRRVKRIRAQPVDGFGREGHQAPGADQLRGMGYAGLVGAHSGASSLSSPATRPVLRHTRYAWIMPSRSPSSTRSTSPSDSLLRRSFTSRYGAST